MIKRKEVKVFKTELCCDICGNEMEFIRRTLLPSLVDLKHKCKKCGYIIITAKLYPITEYEEIK